MALSRTAKATLLGAVALAAAVGVLSVQRFRSYVDEDPRLCLACHRASPEFGLWAEGSHRSVPCQRCHHSTPEQGVAMLAAFVAGGRPQGKHAEVVIGSCAGCHFSHDPRWREVVESPGHRVHWTERKITCVRCHAASMHGFAPVATACGSCHPGHAVGVHGMESLHCFACHTFIGHGERLRPTRRDCLRCHAARGVDAPMDADATPMKMDCSSCHRPHRPTGETLAPCGECHRPEDVRRGGLHRSPGHDRCLECHRPHVWVADPSACSGCHPRAAEHANGKGCGACHGFEGMPAPASSPPGTVPTPAPNPPGAKGAPAGGERP
jgi:hypothetical protein